MKVLKEGICYVDDSDLSRMAVPSFVFAEIDNQPYIENGLVELKDPRSIEFIRGRDDILDYDEVSSLSVEEIEKLYQETSKRLSIYAQRWLDTPMESRERLYHDEEYMKNYDMLKYRSCDLITYKNNKDQVDKRIRGKLSPEGLVKEIRFKVVS